MQNLVKKETVNYLNYDTTKKLESAKPVLVKKPFKNCFNLSETATIIIVPLELVHSNVCGKIGQRSLGGAEYSFT